MLTRIVLNIYGIVGVFIMAVLLILVAFKLVPTSYFLPLFFMAFAIWAGRMVMRVMLVRKERREGAGELKSPEP